MNYVVGTRVDLKHLNPPQTQTSEPAFSERIMSLPSKLLPGSRVTFMRMAQGLIVMSVVEPPMTLAVG
jgi:hypothetical protein